MREISVVQHQEIREFPPPRLETGRPVGCNEGYAGLSSVAHRIVGGQRVPGPGDGLAIAAWDLFLTQAQLAHPA
jgi:hypothetical protein